MKCRWQGKSPPSLRGRSTQFTFYRGEHPGELIMCAINYLETIKETGIEPGKVHTTDFSQIQL